MIPTDNATALSRTLASTATIQLAEIHSLDAFGTPIEERFERLARIGQRALRVPVVAITVITQDTQWFKSVLGWPVTEMPIDKSHCPPGRRDGQGRHGRGSEAQSALRE